MRRDLVAWQWQGYPDFHRDRLNLLVHLFAVPAFGACVLGAVASAVALQPAASLASLVGAALAFAAQGAGHRREANPPIPFDGPADALSRIALEQSFTFYRFLVTGGWWAAWTGAAPR